MMDHSARRATSVALVLALAIAGQAAAVPSTVRAAGATPSTTELWLPDLNPKPVGRTTDLVARIQPGDASGSVTFYDDDNGDRTPLGSAPVTLDPYVMGSLRATLTLPADMAAGTYRIVAVYSGNDTYAGSESELVDFVVGPRPTTTQLNVYSAHDPTGATAQRGDQVDVMTEVLDAGQYTPNQPPITGTLTLTIDGASQGVLAPNAGTTLDTTGWALGTHTINAVYDPGSSQDYAGSSTSTTIDIVSNAVEAVGYAPSPATFYPYKDGYKDTTAIRGRRDETASVTAKIYSPTGKLVRTLSVSSGIGTWSVTWNGRNSAGSIVAAGRYKIRQTVRDALGATRTLPSAYVNVSAKRIYTKTITLKQTTGQKDAGSLSKGWIGWKFTLPSATVYKKLVFGVYGVTGVPLGLFGPHSYSYCPSTTTWDWYDCMAPAQTFPTSLGWQSVRGSTSANRHGATVKLYAVGGGGTRVGYARVVVTYGVLK